MKRIAYLTIDDAPRTDFRMKLEFLKNMGIPAVFYCTGEALENGKNDAVFALKEGYIIGNHSYSHQHFSTLTLEEAYSEIERTDELLKEIYNIAGKNFVKTFRFPYGDKGWGDDPNRSIPSKDQRKFAESIQNYLQLKGYSQPVFKGLDKKEYFEAGLLDDVDVFWTFDCREWEFDGSDVVKEKIFSRLEKDEPENWFGLNSGTTAEIILTHDHDETTSIFKPLITSIAEKNFVFKLPEFK